MSYCRYCGAPLPRHFSECPIVKQGGGQRPRCPRCNGTGIEPGSIPSRNCRGCGGTGVYQGKM